MKQAPSYLTSLVDSLKKLYVTKVREHTVAACACSICFQLHMHSEYTCEERSYIACILAYYFWNLVLATLSAEVAACRICNYTLSVVNFVPVVQGI